MTANRHQENPGEKERIRAEIGDQIQRYLERGGTIEVVNGTPKQCKAGVGNGQYSDDSYEDLNQDSG